MTGPELKKHLETFHKKEDQVTGYRRALHMIPEKGLEEYKTADYICSVLQKSGIEFKREETAITAIIRGKTDSPCIALRADIDALPITEETGLPYCSKEKGMMHACGHDGHTAIALASAQWFQDNKDLLKGTVKIFFQPAEETVGGAQIMVSKGALKNPSVDRVYGLHLMPYIKAGQIEVKAGALNGSSTYLTIHVNGKAGHGAYPESGIDAILIASQVISGAHTLISRRVSPLDQAVISFGTIRGGQAGNIIADTVVIDGTMRTTDDSLRDRLVEQLKTLIENTCLAYGAVGKLDYSYSYPALINDKIETERIKKLAISMLGKNNVMVKERPSMGVEDFSYFLKEKPGVFYHLGCGPENKEGYPLHTSHFDLDEKSLIYGVALQTALTLNAMKELEKGNDL